MTKNRIKFNNKGTFSGWNWDTIKMREEEYKRPIEDKRGEEKYEYVIRRIR